MRAQFAMLFIAMVSAFQASAVEYQVLPSENIVQAARDELDVKLGNDRDTAIVSVIGKPEAMNLVRGRLRLAAGTIAGPWPRSRVGVPVSVSVDGRLVRSATVWFAISLNHEVLGYSEEIPAGTHAESLATAPVDIDVATVHGTLVSGGGDIHGMRLRHSVMKGAPVLKEDFEVIPDVDRQQRVEVHVAYRGIRLTTHGLSTKKGYAGDVVPVQIDGALALVRGRVIGKGEVQVVE